MAVRLRKVAAKPTERFFFAEFQKGARFCLDVLPVPVKYGKGEFELALSERI